MSAWTSEIVRSARFFATAALLSFCAAALGQGSTATPDSAGRFISVTGPVSIVGPDGSRRAAQRDDGLRPGESIVTGPDALAQLRLRDGSLFSVRAETEIKLDEFRFAGRDDRNAGFAMSIVKGGFRTITGLIALLNRSNYRIATPAATIGVRGTHFETVHLPAALQQVPAGTYNRVFEGITQLQNSAGANLVVSRNQTAFAGLGNVQPVLIVPPPALFGRPTPVPRAASRGLERAAEKAAPASLGEDGAPGRRELAPAREGARRELGLPAATSPTDRAVAPIERPAATIFPVAPTTTIERSTTLAPIAPSTTIQPSTTLRTIQPSLQTIQPSTTLQTIQPSLQTIQPSIQTIQPSTTIQSPTTLTAPVTQPSTTSPTRTISPTISR